MALLNQFIDFDPIIDSLWKKFQPEVNQQLTALRGEVVAMLPVLAAACAAALKSEFPVLLKAILDKDPDAPFGLSNIFDLSEFIRNSINDDPNVPIQIPKLEDVIGGIIGQVFDGR